MKKSHVKLVEEDINALIRLVEASDRLRVVTADRDYGWASPETTQALTEWKLALAAAKRLGISDLSSKKRKKKATVPADSETSCIFAAEMSPVQARNCATPVHNHGTEDGPGIACPEYLIGNCRLPIPAPNTAERGPSLLHLSHPYHH